MFVSEAAETVVADGRWIFVTMRLFFQGGSESWFTESNVAIASLAFHPTAQLLLIATNNELHFWDWSRPEPFAVVKTGSDTERVRWVRFWGCLLAC